MTDQIEGGSPLSEAQSYNQIGSESPELHAATEPRKGWQGADPEPQIDQFQAHDFSFWNKRANRQDQGSEGEDNYAAAFFGPDSPSFAHPQTDISRNTAGTTPDPYTGYSEDGIVPGAK